MSVVDSLQISLQPAGRQTLSQDLILSDSVQ